MMRKPVVWLLGTPLGSQGKQYISWIDLDDLVGLFHASRWTITSFGYPIMLLRLRRSPTDNWYSRSGSYCTVRSGRFGSGFLLQLLLGESRACHWWPACFGR